MNDDRLHSYLTKQADHIGQPDFDTASVMSRGKRLRTRAQVGASTGCLVLGGLAFGFFTQMGGADAVITDTAIRVEAEQLDPAHRGLGINDGQGRSSRARGLWRRIRPSDDGPTTTTTVTTTSEPVEPSSTTSTTSSTSVPTVSAPTPVSPDPTSPDGGASSSTTTPAPTENPSPSTSAGTSSPITAAPTPSTRPAPVMPEDPVRRNTDGPFRVTVGTSDSTPLDTSSPTVAESQHGMRVYCTVSHFSYDDPIVHPGDPGRAHLHMFWGNTGANAFSTGDSLDRGGRSSCEGGRNNRAAYWTPALLNENNEAVLPENIFVYYKSFSHNQGFDRTTLKPIPNGLSMLSKPEVANSGSWHFSTSSTDGGRGTKLSVSFPNCVAVDNGGNPILTSADNISHLSFTTGLRTTPSGCPTSHPYRIPQLFFNVTYDVPFNSGWYLSSDMDRSKKGQSLHADYIAAWDEATMDGVVLCNREMKASCEFSSRPGSGRPYRLQLPDRFVSPSGEILYRDSTRLVPSVDRTPFGSSLTAMP